LDPLAVYQHVRVADAGVPGKAGQILLEIDLNFLAPPDQEIKHDRHKDENGVEPEKIVKKFEHQLHEIIIP
jgi:hypothetical protein